MRSSRSRGGVGDEGGFSLPELLVSITLMAIISAAVISSVVAIQRNLGAANATMNDMGANRIAIERVGALLRGAIGPDGTLDAATSALEFALPGDVQLYSVTGRDPLQNPVRVRLTVEGTDLVERIWDPVPDLSTALAPDELPTWPGTPVQRVIGRNVLDAAVFTYWSHQDDGTPVSRCGIALPSPSGADLSRVDSVSFRLRVQEPTTYTAAPSDLQGWARFASDADLGFADNPDSAGCLDVRGFGYSPPVTP